MHRILSQPFNDSSVAHPSHELFIKDWPVVYILENGQEMYIGETGNATYRFRQHLKRQDRRKLSRSHLIVDDEYNKSATLDIESLLIQYMIADKKYKLQNGNGGLANHDYFDRERYKAKFEVLWQELQAKNLTLKDLVQLRNTDLFKYSPYKALTEEQLGIAETIKDYLLVDKPATHIINGGAGTGKSVLASYLVKYLQGHKDLSTLKVALVVPMTGLRKTLKKVFSNIEGLSSNMVVGPNEVVGKHFDVLIVDEAHRLRRRVNLSGYGTFDTSNRFYNLGNEGTQLDWILAASDSQILMYDPDQNVMPGDIKHETFAKLPAYYYQLTSQLRVLAGSDYIEYIDNILSATEQERRVFGTYDARYFDSLRGMMEAIFAKEKSHGLARLVAGYAWTWETKKANSRDYDIELEGLRLKWNSTVTDWVNSANAINEIGCIHTVQGYDLNYVGVIIGPELSYDPLSRKLRIDRQKYKDINGKRSVESDDELRHYILNIYKTLLTRGIQGTYIHAVDPELAKYLKRYF